MLHDKWLAGCIKSIRKQSHISIMRGSNDLIDPYIYIQIKDQFEPGVEKLYMSTKTLPKLDVFNFTIINNIDIIDNNIIIRDLHNPAILFNNQYPNRGANINEVSSICTIACFGWSSNIFIKIINAAIHNNICLADEVQCETFIRKNICNKFTLTQDTFFINPKCNNAADNITNISNISYLNNIKLDDIKQPLQNRIQEFIYWFNLPETHEDKPILLTKIIEEYHNRGVDSNLLSSYRQMGGLENTISYINYDLESLKVLTNDNNTFKQVMFTCPSSVP